MRVYFVTKSRKQWRCHKCGSAIEKGDSYRWWQHMHERETRRCLKCGPPRPSDLATGDKMQRALAAQEQIEDAMADVAAATTVDEFNTALEQLKSVCEEAATEIRQVGEEYEEAASNMETAFPNGSSVIDEIREKSETCNTWADALDSIDLDITAEDCDTCSGSGMVECDTCHSTGEVPGEDDDPSDVQCDDCGGAGEIQCPDCDGTGSNLKEAIDTAQSNVDDANSETIG